MFDLFEKHHEVVDKQDNIFDKQHEELVHLKLETLRLSEDTMVLK